MAMNIEKTTFGVTNHGETVTCYRLQTAALQVELLNYGATIHAIKVPDRKGAFVDVTLGYDTVAEYEMHDGYLGACIGRVGNRIGSAQFVLNDETYPLAKNDGKNHLHGGVRGFDKYVWQAENIADGIRFSRLSSDGEEGYPGNLLVHVTYRVKDGVLTVDYDATSDADTLCSLTNHSYFNLNGGGSVLKHKLQIHADYFLENDSGCLPTGKLISVHGTPFDFRVEKEIGQDIGNDDIQLKNCGGYDHNFCLSGDETLREVATLYSDQTGIMMTVWTTMPGMQMYSANFLTKRSGKHGRTYQKHGAVCLETQFFPNAMACDGFKQPILRAGTQYHHTTLFAFSNR